MDYNIKNLGRVETYEVDRETKLGYVLVQDGSDDEYFLHHNECNGRSFIPGDKVRAFLYIDKKNRLAATLFPPLIEVNKTALLKVVNVVKETGLFINIGISKDILLSADDLPKDYKIWPQVDDYIPCELKVRAGRLVLRFSSKPELLRICKKQERLKKDDLVRGYVYRITAEGINLVTEDFEVIFIYKTNFRKKYRLGELVETKIIDIHEEDYSGTIIKNKEFQIYDDEEIILNYLKNNNGVMLITEKSSPELINKLFNMSKSAFKNALGKLYKNKKIQITDTKIILLEDF